ncbi:hypothetical protein B0G81_6811 [Paraburkholderia sp. BL6665CI2N2]|uniref:hypothetical protein n=1 Tax=Paraburkholderia sp. BL6665CI2N2 TaxID=1938806 RepID=UPI00106607BE|nr:hypothetical protein [Paraburkholderia sp. BL6665CI2N2]TDY26301.1 hypothetical protein B0G81_6811 [Paraburkholderia sp. BL6665CI2N2]
MSTNQVQICNLALAAVGTRSTIASLDEGSGESNQCSLHYDVALEAALRGVHWNFARKQVQLALIADATQGQAVPQPWTYEYALPANCLLARFVLPQMAITGAPFPVAQQRPVPFIIGSDEDSDGNDITVLLTNEPLAQLVYTARITNPAIYDPSFVDAFVPVLGSKLAIPLTGDKGTRQTLIQLAQALLNGAQVSNGNEGLTVIDHQPDWMRVRGFAADWIPDGSQWFNAPIALTPYD